MTTVDEIYNNVILLAEPDSLALTRDSMVFEGKALYTRANLIPLVDEAYYHTVKRPSKGLEMWRYTIRRSDGLAFVPSYLLEAHRLIANRGRKLADVDRTEVVLSMLREAKTTGVTPTRLERRHDLLKRMNEKSREANLKAGRAVLTAGVDIKGTAYYDKTGAKIFRYEEVLEPDTEESREPAGSESSSSVLRRLVINPTTGKYEVVD